MIGNDAPLFGRLITAMITPFDKKGNLDHDAAERIVEHLIKTGTTTILVSGTTGESPTLSDQEKNELLSLVIDKTKNRAKVIAGTGSNCTKKSIESSASAESSGADGLLIVAPYYNKPSQAGIKAHIKEIAKSTSLPIIVYNIPGRTGINILPSTICELSQELDNVHAVKESSGDIDQAAEIARCARADFRIYSGDDNLTLPFLSVGACGVVSVASHVAGDAISKMIESFFQGRTREAMEIHCKYLPIFKGLFAAPNPTCVKQALSMLGLCQSTLRLPLVSLDSSQIESLESLMIECELLSPDMQRGLKCAGN